MAEGGSHTETDSETARLINPEVSVISTERSLRRKSSCSAILATVNRFSDDDTEIPALASSIQAGDGDGVTASDESRLRRQLTHCHDASKDAGVDKKARRKLIIASLLCLVFMIGEIVGGLLAHSLAVVSDAAHLLTDFASFMISLVALYLASKPATKKLSFGWHRAEILGALVSILMLWVITGVLCYSAVLRVKSGDYEINATIMLITAATGVAFNIVLGLTLHQHGHSHGGGGGHSHKGHSHEGHSHEGHGHVEEMQHENSLNAASMVDQSYQGLLDDAEAGQNRRTTSYGSITDSEPAESKKKHDSSNINVKAAFIHVLGDFFQSVGVLVAAIIIFFKPEWKIADPICTFLFSVFVLITTISIMWDILVVLMEGTPRNLNFEEVRDTLLSIEGVRDYHDLRLWSLTMNKTALSIHLAVDKGVDPMHVVRTASQLIQEKYNISQSTIQVEEYEVEMDDCTRCQVHKN